MKNMISAHRLSTKFVIAVTLAMAWSIQAAQQPPPATVTTADVVQEEMESLNWVPGTVVSRSDARIAAEISGRIEWMAEIGDKLKKGEVIARVDNNLLKLQLRDNIANIKRLEAQSEYSSKQLERLRSLAATNNTALNEIDRATSELETARQQLEQARVARDRTRYLLSQTEITAPFPGQIAERLSQPGEHINIGGAVARLVDTSNLEVQAQAPLGLLAYVNDGDGVEIKTPGAQIPANIRTIIPIGDERSRSFELRVATEGSGWIIGSAVSVGLPTSEKRSVMAVPRDALILRSNRTFVYKVDPENLARQVEVSTGIGSGDRIEVRGELAPGDKVVIRGGETLSPGQPVTVTNES